MKILFPILVILSLVALACDANEAPTKNASKAENLISHYFGKNSHVSNTQKLTYVSGDFNNDGNKDIAILFQPSATMKPNTQVKTSTPWQFPGSEQSNKYYASLAIINGNSDGFLSSQTKVFGLLDYSGVLETPSFKLILMNSTDKEYKQHQSMLPLKTTGDLIILPTEAGIDTYIYWNKDKYDLFMPEEVP